MVMATSITIFLLSLTVLISSIKTNATKPIKLRVNYIYGDSNRRLQEKARRVLVDDPDKRAPLIGNDRALLLANISIGQPPVQQLVVVDISNEMLWVQCQPCTKCVHQSNPIYDPSQSSSYINVACTAPNDCGQYKNASCDSNGEYCLFINNVGDGSIAKGNIAHDQLVLQSSTGTPQAFPMYLGCAHENNAGSFFDGQISGVLGLGYHSQVAPQQGGNFSYCLGNIHDPTYSFNTLIIGNQAKLIGYKTPFEVFDDGFYYLTLISISIGDNPLTDIDTTVFQRNSSGNNGVVISSTTPYLWLNKAAFIPFRDEIRRLLRRGFQEFQHPSNPSMVCFRGDMQRDLSWFPQVTFHLAPRYASEFQIDYRSIFFPLAREAFCLAAMESGENGTTTIGVLAQQNYNFGFDTFNKQIHFYPADCSNL